MRILIYHIMCHWFCHRKRPFGWREVTQIEYIDFTLGYIIAEWSIAEYSILLEFIFSNNSNTLTLLRTHTHTVHIHHNILDILNVIVISLFQLSFYRNHAVVVFAILSDALVENFFFFISKVWLSSFKFQSIDPVDFRHM